MSSAFNIPAGWREVLARAKEGLGAGGRNHGDQAFIDYGAALIDHIEEGIEALTAPTHPVDAVPGEPVARNEHIDEIRATLQGAHAIMESVCAMERRIGPVGSHARGYTWKINAALRHLDAIAASVAVQGEPVAPLSKSQSKGMNQADLVAYADRERAASLVASEGWPAGYCLDPNGRMSIPLGGEPHWSFGYECGYGDAMAVKMRATCKDITHG
jgi:hypothetical protein